MTNIGRVATLCLMIGSMTAPAGAHSEHFHRIEEELIHKACDVPAASLLAPAKPIKEPTVPLEGTIEEYIRAVVRTHGSGDITKKSVMPCPKDPGHVCVEIMGEACPASNKGNENCESMYLTVRIDMTEKPVLESAAGLVGKTAIHDQSDIERDLKATP